MDYPCTNNVAEYEALMLGFTLALDMGVRVIEVCGDAQLIVNQVTGSFAVKKPHFFPYHARVQNLLRRFDDFTIRHIPRTSNFFLFSEGI